MPLLELPSEHVRESFADAIEEFAEEGRHRELDVQRLRTVDGFAAFVEHVCLDASPDIPRAQGIVPQTELWWIDGDAFYGYLQIRHSLTEQLRRIGGHIGYAVRPSARRLGHATAMLAASKPFARELGIDPALVTCDIDNVASRRVIECNGGVLDSQGDGKLRFWVPTHAEGA